MFNFDPNDPRKYGMMQMALALMANKSPNLGQAIGQSGLMGMQGYQQQRAMNAREKEEQQQAQMREQQMEQFRQAQASQQGLRSAFQTAFAPPKQLDPYEVDQGVNPGGGGGMPEFMRLAAPHMDPMQAVSMMQKRGPIKMGKDDRLVDPDTHRELVGAAPEAQKPPVGMRDVNGRWEYDKNYLDGQERIGRSRASPVSVTNVGERAEARALGEQRAKNYADIQGLASAARKEMALLSGLEKIPLETGKLTPANATVAAWLTAAGAKDADLKRIASGAQTFEAFTNDLVMQQQLAQKGPQTESDAKRLQMTQAQLSNTPEANRLNVSFRKALAKRTIEQERFYADWIKKNKGTLEGAEDAWFNGKGGSSIWDEPELKKYQSGGGSGVIDFNQLPRG